METDAVYACIAPAMKLHNNLADWYGSTIEGKLAYCWPEPLQRIDVYSHLLCKHTLEHIYKIGIAIWMCHVHFVKFCPVTGGFRTTQDGQDLESSLACNVARPHLEL